MVRQIWVAPQEKIQIPNKLKSCQTSLNTKQNSNDVIYFATLTHEVLKIDNVEGWQAGKKIVFLCHCNNINQSKHLGRQLGDVLYL